MKHAKLWKRVLHEGVADADKVGHDLLHHIITAPIIMDSRPSDQVTGGLVMWDDKRGLAMPFPEFWYEYPEPSGVSIGLLAGALTRARVVPLELAELAAPSVMHVRCAIVYSSPQTPPLLMADATVGLTPEGDVVQRPTDRSLIVGLSYKHPQVDAHTAVFTPMANLFECLLMLSCKNVVLGSRPVEPKQHRLASKRHGVKVGGYRYHVLLVRPAGAKSDAPAQEIGNMPRHVCRGHFAEYGPKYGKGKLFGRLEGRFYIPPHVKGKAENGIVEKDYEVRASNHQTEEVRR